MSDWTTRAACRGLDPALFYPDSETEDAYRPGQAICRWCPVRESCLADAMREETGKRATNRHGLYGALSPMQRGALEFDLEHGTNSCYVNDLCRCPPCTQAAKSARRKAPAAA
jgi:hypothetical protein